MIPELQEHFVGSIQPHIWWGTEPSPPRKRSCQEQLEDGLLDALEALPSWEEVNACMERRREKRRKEEESVGKQKKS